MKMRQALLTPVALAVLAALAGAPAGAQDATTSATMLSEPTTTSSLTTSSASGVSIKGIVSGQPESVSFSGQAQINSRLVRDPDFGKPILLLTIDLSGVSGVGSSTRAKYVVLSPENVQRHLAASHQVQITFPFMSSKSNDSSSARTGVASFALNFDVNTGAVTSAAANVSSPAF
jgi:hypothetical protein